MQGNDVLQHVIHKDESASCAKIKLLTPYARMMSNAGTDGQDHRTETLPHGPCGTMRIDYYKGQAGIGLVCIPTYLSRMYMHIYGSVKPRSSGTSLVMSVACNNICTPADLSRSDIRPRYLSRWCWREERETCCLPTCMSTAPSVCSPSQDPLLKTINEGACLCYGCRLSDQGCWTIPPSS